MFGLISGLVLIKSKSNPVETSTTWALYNLFYKVYRLTYILCVIGCLFMIMTYFGLHNVYNRKAEHWIYGSLMFIFCGLYFGCLWREVVDCCTSKIASSIGLYTTEGLPFKHFNGTICSLCGFQIILNKDKQGVYEKMCSMNCGHIHHEFCVKVWLMVGRKKSCPYCKNNLNLFENLWFWPHHVYGELLDWMKLIIIWSTLVTVLARAINLLVIAVYAV